MKESIVGLGPKGSLVGVYTEPVRMANGDVPAVIIPNAGITHRSGPFRLHVDVARRLASLGYSCLRLDLAGIGDSPGRGDDVPEQEGTLADARSAMDFLNGQAGTTRFVLFGLCSGADDAHLIATRDGRVVGLVALDAFAYPSVLRLSLRQFGRLVGQPRHVCQKATAALRSSKLGRTILGPPPGPRAETKREERFQSFQRDFPPQNQVASELESLVGRKVQQLYIYSGGYKLYNYTRQFFDDFPNVRHNPGIDVEYFKDADHTYMLLADREQLLARVETWMTSRFPIGSPSGGASGGEMSGGGTSDSQVDFKAVDLSESCLPAIAVANRPE
jgi:pimeloyl-ACP methyl ester carboxylesterase